MARRKDRRDDSGRTTALIYVRVSKIAPEDEGRKVSPTTQVERCKALPALKGLTAEVFEDLDYSGKNTKRPGFQQMMDRAERGDVAVVACYSVSRLSRSVVDLYSTLEQLQKDGVGFASATEPYDTTSPAGKFFFNIVAGLAQFEREQTVERVTDNLRQLKMRGKLLGRAPTGYKRVEIPGTAKGRRRRPETRLELDPVAAPIVRRVFALYASGRFSVQALADHLNAS